MDIIKGLDILFPMLILFIAVHISASTVLKTMIERYKQQAFVLAAFVIFTALTSASWAIGAVALLPFLMGVSIKPILARATLVTSEPLELDVRKWLGFVEEAELTWLEHGRLRLPAGYSFILDATLTTLAFVIAYNLGSALESIEKISLAVSLALLMLGLFVMINNQDLLAQVIGLLVSEHGLFLAAIRVVRQKQLAIVLAVSLFFYLALTLTILLWVLPSLRKMSKSLEIKDQTQLKG